MNRLMSSMLVMGMILSVGAIATAQPRDDRPPPPHGPPPPLDEVIADLAGEIGIDAATVQAIRDIVQAARPEFELLHQALRDAFDAGDRDAARQLHEELRAKHEAVMAQVEALLTAEQREALRRALPPPPPGPPHGHGRHGDCRNPPPDGERSAPPRSRAGERGPRVSR
jgi:Spy/CpxP family protein refolding chaperone